MFHYYRLFTTLLFRTPSIIIVNAELVIFLVNAELQ